MMSTLHPSNISIQPSLRSRIVHGRPVSRWMQGGQYKAVCTEGGGYIVQELCESRGGRPGLSVLTSLLVSVDVKIY